MQIDSFLIPKTNVALIQPYEKDGKGIESLRMKNVSLPFVPKSNQHLQALLQTLFNVVPAQVFESHENSFLSPKINVALIQVEKKLRE